MEFNTLKWGSQDIFITKNCPTHTELIGLNLKNSITSITIPERINNLTVVLPDDLSQLFAYNTDEELSQITAITMEDVQFIPDSAYEPETYSRLKNLQTVNLGDTQLLNITEEELDELVDRIFQTNINNLSKELQNDRRGIKNTI